MKKLIVLFSLLVLVLSACSSNEESGTSDTTSAPSETTTSDVADTSTTFTITEVSEHNSEPDCWMIIDNKVYDVTAYMTQHPGGSDELLRGCGMDATQLFETKGGEGEDHSKSADKLKEGFYIGDVN